MKDIIVIPDWRKGNPYLNLLTSSLRGVVVNFCNFPNGLFPLNTVLNRNFNVDVIHLHWVNDLIAPAVWASTDARRRLRCALIAADLLLVRARGVRVVWTIHNFVSHETENITSELKARSTLARFVSHIIIHSSSALNRVRIGYGKRGLEDDRVSIIRHGNYDGCYPYNIDAAESFRRRFGLKSKQIVILFFGAVRPYKGVERMLSSFAKCTREDLKLIIAGKPFNDNYKMELKSLTSKDSRIIFDSDFIADSEVAALYGLADVVVIPFDRTLTSGSALLAMTMSKPIIFPEIARELDLADETGAIYFSDEAHLSRIFDNLEVDELIQMGRVNRKIADSFNWTVIGEQTIHAYSA